MENHAEIVRQILDKMDEPTGKETVYFPKWKGSPLEGHNDYKCHGLVASLDHRQMTLLGQEISKKVGERYTLLPLQTSCDLVHSDKKFKEMNVDYWLHNEPVILEVGEIIAHPIVKEIDGKLQYDGKIIKAEINDSDVFDTLAKAGLMKKPERKVWDGGITYENGEASVGSLWDTDKGCFRADADRPSGRRADGVVALLKTDEKAEFSEKPNVRQVAEDEYQEFLQFREERKELLEKSKKYDALKEDFERLKKRF